MDTRIEIHPGRELNLSIYKNPSSKGTAFLIHGLGGRADQWKEQVDILKKHYTLIIPHLLGHGQSEKPKVGLHNPYSFPKFDNDLHAIFNRFQTEQNIVLGHSYGGALATSLAMDNQNKINHLILIDPLPCQPMIQMPFVYRLPAFILEWIRPLLEKNFEKLAFDPTANQMLISNEKLAGNINRMYVIKATIEGMKKIPNINVSQLQVPTLIIIGEEDKVISPLAIKEYYQAIPYHQFQVVSHAAHMSMLEKPNEVNSFLLNFLRIS